MKYKSKVYLVENIEKGIKDAYSNLKKVSDEYPLSYWGMNSSINSKGDYRKDGYLITKMIIK